MSSESGPFGPSTADILNVPDTFHPMFGFYQPPSPLLGEKDLEHSECQLCWDHWDRSHQQRNQQDQLVLGKLSRRFCITSCSKTKVPYSYESL